jgi:polyhydroxyalkanoate synthesis regulator phasin
MADTDIVDRLLMSLQVNPQRLLRNADIAEAANEIKRLRRRVEALEHEAVERRNEIRQGY